jgi:hypothetical protein
VAIVDCSRKDDTLPSREFSTELPNAIKRQKNIIENASVDQAAYANALAVILGDLVRSTRSNSPSTEHAEIRPFR